MTTKQIKLSIIGRQIRLLLTAVLCKRGCSASYDSFVVCSSAVLRLNFCAKNPPLRQAAKRYMLCLDKHTAETINDEQ